MGQAVVTRCIHISGVSKLEGCGRPGKRAKNRQDAVKALAEQCDLVIVVGSPNSSNSRRLKEVAVARGIDSYLIDGPEEIDPVWLEGKQRIGVSAGASAPEILVSRVVDRIRSLTGGKWRNLPASTRRYSSRCRGSCPSGGGTVTFGVAHRDPARGGTRSRSGFWI